jgi:hypothetical protein
MVLSLYSACLLTNIFAVTNDPPSLNPNDPLQFDYYQRYAVNDYIGDRPGLQLINAWPITTGSSNVTVGIVGSGIYPFAELEGRLVLGHNIITDTEDTTSISGEDNGLATILGGNANNGRFGAGIDWNCKIMPIVVMDSLGRFDVANYARGIDYATEHGCKIILCTPHCGTNVFVDALICAVSNATARGSIVLAEALSRGTVETTEYPGVIRGVIAAGAAGYVVPPQPTRGVDVWSAYPLDYSVVTASSYYPTGLYMRVQTEGIPMPASAAMVAGVCSLLVSVRPELTTEQARGLICLGAVQPRSVTAKDFDPFTGWGYVNAYNSLILAQTRIEDFRMNKGVAECSWASPVNASNREPYTVEFSPSVTGNWVAPDLSVYTYSTNRTFFRGTSMMFTNENLFCRLRLRDVPEP